MAVINGVDYSKPEQFVSSAQMSTPIANLMPPSYSPTSNGAVSSPRSTGGGWNPVVSSSSPPPMEVSTRQISLPDVEALRSIQPGSGGSGGYVDATPLENQQFLNAQLQNALLMQNLGYGVDISPEGQYTFQRPSYDYLTQYGSYGQAASPYVYESDYLRAQPHAYQQTQERSTYPRYQQDQYQYDDYGYYGQPRYQNGYYSRYGQRYYPRSYYQRGGNYNRNRYYNQNRGQYWNRRRSDNYAYRHYR